MTLVIIIIYYFIKSYLFPKANIYCFTNLFQEQREELLNLVGSLKHPTCRLVRSECKPVPLPQLAPKLKEVYVCFVMMSFSTTSCLWIRWVEFYHINQYFTSASNDWLAACYFKNRQPIEFSYTTLSQRHWLSIASEITTICIFQHEETKQDWRSEKGGVDKVQEVAEGHPERGQEGAEPQEQDQVRRTRPRVSALFFPRLFSESVGFPYYFWLICCNLSNLLLT